MPYHIHFDQIESFQVLSGSIGTPTGYKLIDTIHTADKVTHKIPLSPPYVLAGSERYRGQYNAALGAY